MKKLALGLSALVIVILLAGVVQRALQNQGILRTSAGKFRVPTLEKQQGGDPSLGWCGDIQESSQGWFLAWRYQDKEFTYDEHNGLDRLFFVRVVKSLLPSADWPGKQVDTRTETNGGHQVAWTSVISPSGSQYGGKVLWYCKDSRRMFIFFTWASSQSEADARSSAFARATLDCHSGPSASPLPIPTMQLPAGYQAAEGNGVEWQHSTNPTTREDVWLSTGSLRATKGEMTGDEVVSGHFFMSAVPGNYRFAKECRVLDSPSLPHTAFQQQIYYFGDADGSPIRPAVLTVWSCSTTGRVYSVVWHGAPLPPGRQPVLTTSFLPHPAFMEDPRCVCGGAR